MKLPTGQTRIPSITSSCKGIINILNLAFVTLFQDRTDNKPVGAGPEEVNFPIIPENP